MLNETQKSICSFIDRAAARCETVDATPATSKQCWFLAGLILKAGDEAQYREFVCNTSFVLTKARASLLIGTYLN